jgi:hypothetical protein
MSIQPHADEAGGAVSIQNEPTGMDIAAPARASRRAPLRREIEDEINALRSANTALLKSNAQLAYDLARAMDDPTSARTDGSPSGADASVRLLRAQLVEATTRAAEARSDADAERERAQEYRQLIDLLHAWHDAPRYRVADAIRSGVTAIPVIGPLARRLWKLVFGHLRAAGSP